jgi:hypothetical protein
VHAKRLWRHRSPETAPPPDRLAHDARSAPMNGLAWPRRTADLGLTVVDDIASALQLDPQWSLQSERGFTWWSKDLAQHVWAEAAIEDDGDELFRVHARAEMLRDFECSDKNVGIVDAIAGFATTSAYAIDIDEQTLSLTASMWMHAGTVDWVRRLFAFVTAVQAADAQVKAPMLAAVTNATVAASAHPSSGPRPDIDDTNNILEDIVAPMGREPSRWAGDDMEQALEVISTAPFNFLATGGPDGLTAEFPFQSKTALLRARTQSPHPQLGNGLLLLLSLPMTVDSAEGTQLAHELNQLEMASLSQAHYLGSWCCQDKTVTHCAFFANALRFGGRDLLNLILSAGARARWVNEFMSGADPGRLPARPAPGPAGTPFVPARDSPVGGREMLDELERNPSRRAAVAGQIADVIAQEAPVAATRLARIVGRRFGLQRVAAKRTSAIIAILRPDQLERTPFGVFVWGPGQDCERYIEFRVSDEEALRTIDEIAPRELLNAMRHLAKPGVGISRDELIRETGGLFGYSRMAAKTRGHLEAIIDHGVRHGLLVDDGATIAVARAGEWTAQELAPAPE